MTIICRRCKTQVNVPEAPGGKKRQPWYTSRGWLAVAIVETLAVAGLLVAGAFFLTGQLSSSGSNRPPENAILLEPGQHRMVEWSAAVETPGGYFRLAKPRVTLSVAGEDPVELDAQAEERPWPPSLVGQREELPARELQHFRLHFTVPDDATLGSGTLSLRAQATLKHLKRQEQDDGAFQVHAEPVSHEATAYLPGKTAGATAGAAGLRWVVFGCALVAAAVAVGSYVFGQKLVTIMCPNCGRAAPAYYYHEKGGYKVSPCPHSNAGPTADYE
jgi:hypothetical protein